MKKFLPLIILPLIILTLITACGGAGKQINSLDDLKTARIATWPFSAYAFLAQENFPDAQMFTFDTLGDLLQNLRDNKIDAFVIGKAIIDAAKRDGVDTNYLPQSLGDVPLAYIFTKNERGRKLCSQMNEFLAKLEAGGELDALRNNRIHGYTGEQTFTKSPSTGASGTLKIGTTADDTPFIYVSNQQIVGYEVELFDKFCAAYGYDYEFQIEAFPTMLADVTTGRVDVGINAIEKIPEREKDLLFANPHYIDQAIVVVDAASASDGNFFAALTDRLKATLFDAGRWKMILDGTGRTIAITLASILFGTVLGFATYLLYREGNRRLNKIIDALYRTLQGVPVLVLLMFFYYVIFGSVEVPASVVAVVVFSIVLSVSVFVMLKSGAESISRGQTEAALSLGFSERRAFVKFILPQVVRNNFKQYQLALNVTLLETTLVGYISVQDLTKMTDLIRARTYDAFVPLIVAAVIYLLLSKLLLFVTDCIARRIDPKSRSREKILDGVRL